LSARSLRATGAKGVLPAHDRPFETCRQLTDLGGAMRGSRAPQKWRGIEPEAGPKAIPKRSQNGLKMARILHKCRIPAKRANSLLEYSALLTQTVLLAA